MPVASLQISALTTDFDGVHTTVITMVDEGELVAVANLHPTGLGDCQDPVLTDLFVKASHRGKGLASEVVKHAMSLLPLNRLHVFAHPERAGAVRMYERLGFERTGEMMADEEWWVGPDAHSRSEKTD